MSGASCCSRWGPLLLDTQHCSRQPTFDKDTKQLHTVKFFSYQLTQTAFIAQQSLNDAQATNYVTTMIEVLVRPRGASDEALLRRPPAESNNQQHENHTSAAASVTLHVHNQVWHVKRSRPNCASWHLPALFIEHCGCEQQSQNACRQWRDVDILTSRRMLTLIR